MPTIWGALITCFRVKISQGHWPLQHDFWCITKVGLFLLVSLNTWLTCFLNLPTTSWLLLCSHSKSASTDCQWCCEIKRLPVKRLLTEKVNSGGKKKSWAANTFRENRVLHTLYNIKVPEYLWCLNMSYRKKRKKEKTIVLFGTTSVFYSSNWE